MTIVHDCVAVAVCMDNGPPLIAAELSVIKAGYTIVPISPDCSHDVAEFLAGACLTLAAAVIDNAGARSPFASVCTKFDVPCILIESISVKELDFLLSRDSCNQSNVISCQDLIYSVNHMHDDFQRKSEEWKHTKRQHQREIEWSKGQLEQIDCLQAVDGLQESTKASDYPISASNRYHFSDEQISHIFFTSGSTGNPKACAVTLQTLQEAAMNQKVAFNLTPEDIIFVGSTVTFDPSLCDIFTGDILGATLATASRTAMVTCLPACLAVTKASYICTTPTMFQAFPVDQISPHQLPSLKTVALGGEVMSTKTAEIWCDIDAARKRQQLFNVYGVTECCGYQSACCISSLSSKSAPTKANHWDTELQQHDKQHENDEQETLSEDNESQYSKSLLKSFGTALTCCADQQSLYLTPENQPNPRIIGRNMGSARLIVVLNYDELTMGDVNTETISADDLMLAHAKTDGVGEVWIVGDQIGAGYVKANHVPRQNVTRGHQGKKLKCGLCSLELIPHPSFLFVDGIGRVYRTGDTARIHNDGAHIELLGRLDWQVKIRGRRINLCGLEEKYQMCLEDIISNTVVTAAQGQLMCWVTRSMSQINPSSNNLRTNGDVHDDSLLPTHGWQSHRCPTFLLSKRTTGCEQELKRWSSVDVLPFSTKNASSNANEPIILCSRMCAICQMLEDVCAFTLRSMLSSHLAPTRVSILSHFPYTASGKVARKKLWKSQRALLEETSDLETSFVLGRSQFSLQTPIQKKIAQILLDQLHLPVSVFSNDNFLELGGDSLLAVRALQSLFSWIATIVPSAPNKNQDSNSFQDVGAFGEGAQLSPQKLLTASIGELELILLATFPHLQCLNTINNVEIKTAAQPEDIQRLSLSSNVSFHDLKSCILTTDTMSASEKPLPTDLTLEDRSGIDDIQHISLLTLNRVSVMRNYLLQAARSPDIAPIKLLLQLSRKRSILFQEQDLIAAYFTACHCGNPPVIEFLNKHVTRIFTRASQSHSNGVWRSPFHVVCTSKSIQSLQAVTSHREYNWRVAISKDEDDMTALHHAARSGAGCRFLNFLLQKPAGPSSQKNKKQKSASKRTLVSKTTLQEQETTWYLNTPRSDKGEGGDVRFQQLNVQKRSNLHSATRSSEQHISIGDVCLDLRDRWGRTPLHWAVTNGHVTTVAELLRSGAKQDTCDNAGETPLAVAERRAQCRATDRGGLQPSVFGAIASLLGGSGKTVKLSKTVLA